MGGGLGEAHVAECGVLFALGLLVDEGQEGRTVDGGLCRRLRVGQFPACVVEEVERGCISVGLALPLDVDTGEVEGIVADGDVAAGERGVDLVGVGFEGDGGGGTDLAGLDPEEGGVEGIGVDGVNGVIGVDVAEAADGGFAGGAVDTGVVLGVQPGSEEGFEGDEGGDGAVVDEGLGFMVESVSRLNQRSILPFP